MLLLSRAYDFLLFRLRGPDAFGVCRCTVASFHSGAEECDFSLMPGRSRSVIAGIYRRPAYHFKRRAHHSADGALRDDTVEPASQLMPMR